jgi:hypothetical protein
VSFAGTFMNRAYAALERGLSDVAADVLAIDEGQTGSS